MTSYKDLSSLPAGSSGNASEKSGPKGLPASAFGRATVPAEEIAQERPNYIFINNTGSYAFLNSSTASINTSVPEGNTGANYSTGSVIYQQSDVGHISPIRLDISPVAWRKTDDHEGDGKIGDISPEVTVPNDIGLIGAYNVFILAFD